MPELTSISLLVTTCAAACVAIITAVQNSRCTKINACCITCVREPPDPHVREPPDPRNVPADRVVPKEERIHEA